MILRYVIPHLISMIKSEEKPSVKTSLLNWFFDWVDMVTGDYINPLYYKVFKEYIMPTLFDPMFDDEEYFLELEDEMFQISLATNLGKLVQFAEKFKYMAQASIVKTFQESQLSGKK